MIKNSSDESKGAKLEIYETNSRPYGLTFGDWTAKWWKWILSIPQNCNPINAGSPEYCFQRSEFPVCFLAGIGIGSTERTCTLSAKKSILMPILNYGATLADEPNVQSEQELASLAEKEMDIISGLNVTLDGYTLPNLRQFRVRSPIFDILLPNDNIFGCQGGPTRGTSDGYWLFLRSLPIGDHEVSTFGSCMSGKLQIRVKYTIKVNGEQISEQSI